MTITGSAISTTRPDQDAPDAAETLGDAHAQPRRSRAWALVGRCLAYGSIALLQLKVIWGMWKFKELEAGDTTSYFMDAWNWLEHGKNNIVWSPLYTSYLGALMGVISNAYAVLIVHRMLIALAATLLVLAVARRMLPPLLAWLVAAWWAVLPINYNTLYTVHLFAVLPVLLAWLAAVRIPRPWDRGMVLGILVASTFLVRNELFVAVACWAVVCVAWEYRDRRAGRRPGASPRSGNRPLLVYGLPLLGAALLIGFFYQRSYIKRDELRRVLDAKHTVNMGQVYTFGLAQRQHDTAVNPWTEYQNVMRRDFGAPEVSLTRMLRSNPRATLGHVLWNVRLTPAGLQLLLFNATSSEYTPDYQDYPPEPQRAVPLSVAGLVVVLAGAGLALWRRRLWWRAWFRPRAAGWLAMGCVLMTAALIIPTQRPRPSYLFAHGIVLMTVVATALLVIVRTIVGTARRWRPRRPRAVAASGAVSWLAAAGIAVAVILVATNGYAPGRGPDGKRLPPPPRPVFELYDRLLPYQGLITRRDTNWLIADFGFEMRHFLGFGKCNVADLSLLKELGPGEGLAPFLDRNGINLVYLDVSAASRLLEQDPELLPEFLRVAPRAGWIVAGSSSLPQSRWSPAGRWLLLWKPPARAEATPTASTGDFAALNPLGYGGEFSGFRVVSGLGPVEGPYAVSDFRVVRWGYGPATRLTVRAEPGAGGGQQYQLVADGLCGLEGQRVTVKVDGKAIGQYPWGAAGQFHQFTLPLDLTAGTHEIEIDYSVWQDPTPTVRLAILYRQLEVRRP